LGLESWQCARPKWRSNRSLAPKTRPTAVPARYPPAPPVGNPRSQASTLDWAVRRAASFCRQIWLSPQLDGIRAAGSLLYEERDGRQIAMKPTRTQQFASGFGKDREAIALCDGLMDRHVFSHQLAQHREFEAASLSKAPLALGICPPLLFDGLTGPSRPERYRKVNRRSEYVSPFERQRGPLERQRAQPAAANVFVKDRFRGDPTGTEGPFGRTDSALTRQMLGIRREPPVSYVSFRKIVPSLAPALPLSPRRPDGATKTFAIHATSRAESGRNRRASLTFRRSLRAFLGEGRCSRSVGSNVT